MGDAIKCNREKKGKMNTVECVECEKCPIIRTRLDTSRRHNSIREATVGNMPDKRTQLAPIDLIYNCPLVFMCVCVCRQVVIMVIYVYTHTSQWLNANCGFAFPLVCFRISFAKSKLSTTGNTAVTVNIWDPSWRSAWRIRPWRRPITAYIFPVKWTILY